jgi:hypothetical protein
MQKESIADLEVQERLIVPLLLLLLLLSLKRIGTRLLSHNSASRLSTTKYHRTLVSAQLRFTSWQNFVLTIVKLLDYQMYQYHRLYCQANWQGVHICHHP